jgi:branched-chain amino acid transport system ATP-binding protein
MVSGPGAMIQDIAPPFFECRGIVKTYGALRAVDNLTFAISDNEILGIGGPNGAGKTTLFDLISGTALPDQGSIRIRGRELVGEPPHRICHLGLARTFQLNAAFESLSVKENVACASYFGGRHIFLPGTRVDRASRERAETAIEMMGLQDFASTRAMNLPVLQRKLLMIASAMATSPRLLLLDEPVGGLTPHEIDSIIGVIDRLRQCGLAIILIEHVMRFMIALADRVMIMHHGQKIFDGSAVDMARDSTVIGVYLGHTAAAQLVAAESTSCTNG